MDTPVAVTSPAAGNPAPTERTGAAAPLVPMQMDPAELQAVDLKGELGCSFAPSPQETPLLMAASFVDKAATSQAVVKLGNRVVKLETQGKGGFDALAKGARFVGPRGLFANVVRTSDEPIEETPQIAMESPRYPAQLVLSRDGTELSIDGVWECGP